AEGRAAATSFPLESFERAVMSKLAEVKASEVLGQNDGPDEVAVLEGERVQVLAKIGELQAELLNGPVAAVGGGLRRREQRGKGRGGNGTRARHKAAHPLRETWSQAQTLLGALDAAPDRKDARLRLRAALRRIASEIRLLVVPQGMDRLGAVQVHFNGGG